MKKLSLYTLLLAAMFAGCNKSSDPILEDADTRLAQRLKEDQQLLVGAQYGWKATIYPKGGKGFYYYFKFNSDNSVDIMADFNNTTATILKTSTYRLKALQWPTLIFDTYSYIHLPSDPSSGISGGTSGAGLQSDFQFAMDKMQGDTFVVNGIDKGNKMTMVKLTSAEQQDILKGQVADRIIDNSTYALTNKAPYLSLKEGVKIDAAINAPTRRIRFGYVDANGTTISKTRAFAITPYGLILDSAFRYQDIVIREFLWDVAAKKYYVKNGAETYDVQQGLVPVVPLNKVFGVGKDYATIEYNATTLKGTLGSDFDGVYMACFNSLKSSGYTLGYIRLTLNVDNSFTMRFSFSNATTTYLADVLYTQTKTPDGAVKFIFNSQNGNAGALAGAFAGTRSYFETNTFNLSWIPNTINGSTLVLGGFVKTTDPAQYFYGVLGN